MSRVAYVDGAFAPLSAARLAVEDRGFQFGDAVYEVWAVRDGRLRDSDGHFERLARSLRELEIAFAPSRAALTLAIRETIRRNRVRDGLVYLQISRGVARRDHAFPRQPARSTLVITARPLDPATQARAVEGGVACITAPDQRWGRCDVKSVNLLANVLAREAARRAGAEEAVLVGPDGFVTEGTASTVWIVTRDGVLRTTPLTANILPGVTRAAILRVAESLQIRVDERAFTLAEAHDAQEMFLTSATKPAIPVATLDGRAIGDGHGWPLARALREAYLSDPL